MNVSMKLSEKKAISHQRKNPTDSQQRVKARSGHGLDKDAQGNQFLILSDFKRVKVSAPVLRHFLI